MDSLTLVLYVRVLLGGDGGLIRADFWKRQSRTSWKTPTRGWFPGLTRYPNITHVLSLSYKTVK